jgi:hypothetical protein
MSAEPWAIPDGVPPGLADILSGALEKRAEKRYLTAAEMADDLEEWLAGDREAFVPSRTTEETWEPAFDYRGVDQRIIDPNVGEDFVPEFLQEQRRAPRQTRKGHGPDPPRPAPGVRPERASTSQELELDLDAVPPRTDRIVRPSRVPDEPQWSLPVDLKWIVGGLVAVVGAAIVYSATRPEPEPEVDLLDEEPMYMDLDEPAPIEEARNNRYSAEGILRAIEAGGWSVKRTHDSNALANVHQQSYRIRKGETELEIELVTTKSNSIAQKLFEDTRLPVQAVVFDNKMVRIFPRSKVGRGAAAELVSLLRRYRDLVAESDDGE